MSTTSSSSNPGSPTREVRRESLLRAAEARSSTHGAQDIMTVARVHESKQRFRRLIDPGITRPNNKEAAELAIKTLETLSRNLLNEPANHKYKCFKLSNPAIKKRIADVNGAVEYAVAMGFHYQVEEFQPVYMFNDKYIEDLRIGSEVLKEHIDREMEKQKHTTTPVSDKETQELIRRKIHLQFLEDRQDKKLKDQKEALRSQHRVTHDDESESQEPTDNFTDHENGHRLGGLSS